MGKIPLAAMDRVIREAGAKRVSDSAKEALRECLEEEAIKITKKAQQYSNHSKRNTILAKDVSLAKE